MFVRPDRHVHASLQTCGSFHRKPAKIGKASVGSQLRRPRNFLIVFLRVLAPKWREQAASEQSAISLANSPLQVNKKPLQIRILCAMQERAVFATLSS